MAGFGWFANFPFEFGGGADLEDIYLAIRASLGNVPGPLDGIDDLWTSVEAYMVEAATASAEVAMYQFFPETSTFGLPNHARAYLVGQVLIPDNLEDEAVRRKIFEQETEDYPLDIELELQAKVYNGSQLSIVPIDHTKARVVLPGFLFYGWTDAYLDVGQFSDHNVFVVRYTLASGESYIPDRVRREVDLLLNEILPADYTWTMVAYNTAATDPEAFKMDGFELSYLDNTPLGIV